MRRRCATVRSASACSPSSHSLSRSSPAIASSPCVARRTLHVLARIFPPLGLAVGIPALVSHAQPTTAQPIPVQPQATNNGISVLGSGIVTATPNTARVTLGVEVTDASLANGQAEAARRMDAVVSKLKAAGIQDTDIRTTNYNINPQYDQSQ